MRRFKDKDGVEWEAEAVAAMPEIQPGRAIPMMGEVAWRVRFSAQDPPAGRLAIVSSGIGQLFNELSEAELRDLLAEAGEGEG